MGVVVEMMQNQCASNGFISAQNHCCINNPTHTRGWLDSQVVSVLDSGTEGPGFKS